MQSPVNGAGYCGTAGNRLGICRNHRHIRNCLDNSRNSSISWVYCLTYLEICQSCFNNICTTQEMLNCTADRSSSSTVLGSHYGGEEHNEDGKRKFFHKVTQKYFLPQRLKLAFVLDARKRLDYIYNRGRGAAGSGD